MKLKKAEYVVSPAMMERILEVLRENWFGSVDDGDGYAIEYNNDNVIVLTHDLETELAKQEKTDAN